MSLRSHVRRCCTAFAPLLAALSSAAHPPPRLTASAAERVAWLRAAHAAGVRNIEMESTLLSSFCRRLGIRVGALNSVIVDRFQGDQVRVAGGNVHAFSTAAMRLAARMIARTAARGGWANARGSP